MGLLSSLFGGEKKKENNQQENKNFDILKYDGIRARNIRQLPYAIKCFEEAIALKEDAETMELLAASYIQTGKTDEARVIYNRLTEIEPESTKVLLSLAGVCFMQEDYAAMKEACQKAIALDDKNKTAFYLASKAEVGEKNYIQAIVMLIKAIAIDEDFKEAYQLRAEVLWNMRQPKEALDDINSILSKDSEDEDALVLKAEICAATGKLEEGISYLDKVLSLNPFNEKAYLIKGTAFLENKEFDQAISVYDEAIELSPENAKFYQERGRAKLLKGDKDGSV